jgi:hypothetical protein
MAKTEQTLSIFLASPSDVAVERDLVDGVVSEWNSLWSDELGVHLKLIRWETHAYPAIGIDGQDVINNQIGDEYDFFLGIMWKRFGTPTNRADSGTAEEFERALSRYRKNGHPQLMFYFKKVESNADADVAQLQAVLQFRGKLEKEGLLHWPFSAPEQFSQLVRVHLTRHVQGWAKRHRWSVAPALEVQQDLIARYNNYSHTVKAKSAALQGIIKQFAKAYLDYVTAHKRRVVEAKAMTDDTPDIVWKLSLIEMAKEMVQYADAAEVFEAHFMAAFSLFIEAALGAAAISIAFPATKTKALSQALEELRKKLHPVYATTGKYIEQLSKVTPNLSGVMLTANERVITAQSKFREHARFGERLLLESEKLFHTKR